MKPSTFFFAFRGCVRAAGGLERAPWLQAAKTSSRGAPAALAAPLLSSPSSPFPPLQGRGASRRGAAAHLPGAIQPARIQGLVAGSTHRSQSARWDHAVLLQQLQDDAQFQHSPGSPPLLSPHTRRRPAAVPPPLTARVSQHRPLARRSSCATTASRAWSVPAPSGTSSGAPARSTRASCL